MHGTHLLHHCSRTQVGVTLSSEAELDAALTMTYSGLSQFCSEFGHSSAVKSILARRGCGEVKKQWLQEQVCSGKIEFQKFLVRTTQTKLRRTTTQGRKRRNTSNTLALSSCQRPRILVKPRDRCDSRRDGGSTTKEGVRLRSSQY